MNKDVVLGAQTTLGDTILWYDKNDSILGGGPSFTIQDIQGDTTVFAESVSGLLAYRNSMMTTDISNINWNGCMFDIIAKKDLTIDSFYLKIFSTGMQKVTVYAKPGSYKGSELIANDWGLWWSDSVFVDNQEGVTTLPVSSKKVMKGDTMGIYFQMQDPASRLSYHSLSQQVMRENDEIVVVSGSGISYQFSNVYFPRDWNGEVLYHYGFNPKGDCSSGLKALDVIASNPEVDLGNDTILPFWSSIILDADTGFVRYEWNDGSSSQFLAVDNNWALKNGALIWLEAEDTTGCIANDTVQVVFNLPNGISGLSNSKRFQVFPNPVNEILNIVPGNHNEPFDIRIINTLGRVIAKQSGLMANIKWDTGGLLPGYYVLEITTDKQIFWYKIVKP
jgi:Secretion system C-terminal sorting domain